MSKFHVNRHVGVGLRITLQPLQIPLYVTETHHSHMCWVLLLCAMTATLDIGFMMILKVKCQQF